VNDATLFAAAWLLTYVLHSTALFAAAWLLERLQLLSRPAARETLWRAALLGALLTASAQSTGLVGHAALHLPFGAPPIAAASPAPESRVPAALPAADIPGVTVPPERDASSAAAPGATPPVELVQDVSAPGAAGGAAVSAHEYAPALLLLVWAAGAGLALLRLLALARLARRQLAGGTPAPEPLATELAELCAAQRVARPRLLIASALAGPISLPGGAIAVPPWAAASLDARHRRALLAHELAHQVRRDPQWQLATLGLGALLWCQPLHALARRRLVELAELQADAWAARASGDPRALAECLAECATQLRDRRPPPLGATITRGSPLLQRVERLLEETPMTVHTVPWQLRIAVPGVIAAAAFLLPGCDLGALQGSGRSSTTITISDDGDAQATVQRDGYALHMETDGATTFLEDESDLASLAPGASFTLSETLDGVTREYAVEADGSGALVRRFATDGHDAPFDAAARQWLAAALPRMFRESGFAAEARMRRLLARGGPERVLQEADAAGSDSTKATWLAALFGERKLQADQLGLALASAEKIGSDFELQRTLGALLDSQALDAPRWRQFLALAQQLGSDHERAEVLTAAAPRLPDDADARAAWLAAAGGMDSDDELGRTLAAGLEGFGAPPASAVQLVVFAAAHLDSDHDLGELLEKVVPRAGQPGIAGACLAAVRELDGDFQRRSVLLALLDAAPLDAADLRTALDIAAGLDASFERGEVLAALAPRVAADAELVRRYRDVASTMASLQRGEALVALDNAGAR